LGDGWDRLEGVVMGGVFRCLKERGIFASWSELDSRSGDLEKKRILKDGNFR
jgi:hypothetical protein